MCLIFEKLNTYIYHSINIYNRYGYIVYRGNVNISPWDGSDTSGKKLPTGVYFYVIKPNEIDASPIQGRVHLRK